MAKYPISYWLTLNNTSHRLIDLSQKGKSFPRRSMKLHFGERLQRQTCTKNHAQKNWGKKGHF